MPFKTIQLNFFTLAIELFLG